MSRRFTPAEAAQGLTWYYGRHDPVGPPLVVNAAAFGLSPSNTAAANGTAMAAIATFVNAAGGGIVDIPVGEYDYDTGPAFTVPVTVQGAPGAVLNYTGNGKAMSLGPAGLDISTYHVDPYVVRGLTFTGAGSASHGLFFNAWITHVRVDHCSFHDFGNSGTAAIWLEDENWDVRIAHCDTWEDNANGTNFLKTNATARNSTRVHVVDCSLHSQGSVRGYGIHLNGAACRVIDSEIAGYEPAVILDYRAQQCGIAGCYFESLGNNGILRYGATAGANDGVFCAYLTITDCFFNLHNTDLSKTGVVLYPTTTNTGLQYCTFENNYVASWAISTPVITQNAAKASQVGNYAERNAGYTDLSTAVTTQGGQWEGAREGLINNGYEVIGTGQATATPDHTGSWGASLAALDTGVNVGNGGAVWFGFSGTKYFAAIKGYAQSGSNNGGGDLVFATRHATADAALTERLRIKMAGGIESATPFQLPAYAGSANYPAAASFPRGLIYDTVTNKVMVSTGAAWVALH